MLVCVFCVVIIMSTEALATPTYQTKNRQTHTLSYVPVDSLTSKLEKLKISTTKHSIFIDVGTLRPYPHRRMGSSKESTYHKLLDKSLEPRIKRKMPLTLLRTRENNTEERSLTFLADKNFNSSSEVKFRSKLSFRRQPMIYAKILTTLAPQQINATTDYREKYNSSRNDRNKTKGGYNIKKKLLTQLQRLKNEIKIVKAQIENDSRTIQDLQNQLRENEIQRTITGKPTVNLLIATDYDTLKTVNLETAAYLIDNNRKEENFRNNSYIRVGEQHSYTDIIKTEDDKTINIYFAPIETQLTKGIDDYRRHSNVTAKSNITDLEKDYIESMSTTKEKEKENVYKDLNVGNTKNTENGENQKSFKFVSNEENVEKLTKTTLSMFDLHEDFETFERFDGEFDWHKFITSDMYIQILKNNTEVPADFRRMLSNAKKRSTVTTPSFDSDLSEAVTSMTDQFWADYYLEPSTSDPQEAIRFAPFDANNSKIGFLVPRPGDEKIIPDSADIVLLETETKTPLKLEGKEESGLKYNPHSDIRFDYINRRRMYPEGLYSTPNGRRNMPTSETTLDPLSYDSLVKDMDKDLEI